MRISKIILVLCACIISGACTKDNSNKTPEWNFDDPSTETVAKRYYLWVDANANFNDYANSQANIETDMAKAADAGFTDIVVDIRPTDGNILYKSDTGIPHTWAPAWVGSEYKKVYRTADFDYLQAFIDAGHKVGLRIHAGFNTMVGGLANGLGNSGLVYNDASKKDWTVVLNMEGGFVSVMDNGVYTEKFLNPANDEAMDYLITLLKDLAAYQDLDGIILDRCRYPGLLGDFSEDSRKKFAEYIGVNSFNWPSDVLPKGTEFEDAIADDFKQPRYYKSWLEFRAKTIHDFVERAANEVHAVNADLQFGVYVGGWYEQYYDVGVNWASPNYATHTYYSSWATKNYHTYGYADHCDQMLIGAYASPGSLYGTWEWSIQGFCTLAKKKIGTACPVIAGGPDVGNWSTTDHYSQECLNAVQQSPKVCSDACGGFFCFDIIHVKWYDYWSYLKAGITASEAK